MPDETTQEFYSIPDAAARLAVSPSWLRRELTQGRFRHRKVGRRYEMSDEHIAEAHAALEVVPAQPEPVQHRLQGATRRRSA